MPCKLRASRDGAASLSAGGKRERQTLAAGGRFVTAGSPPLPLALTHELLACFLQLNRRRT
jgi:hypothetical protein